MPGSSSAAAADAQPSAYEALLGKRQDAAPADGGERRTKLRRYDKMAAQCLNPEGVSPIHNADLRGVWELAMLGNKDAKYFSELCDEDDYQRGVGISSAAEAIFSMGTALEQPVFRAVLQERVLEFVDQHKRRPPRSTALGKALYKEQRRRSPFA